MLACELIIFLLLKANCGLLLFFQIQLENLSSAWKGLFIWTNYSLADFKERGWGTKGGEGKGEGLVSYSEAALQTQKLACAQSH